MPIKTFRGQLQGTDAGTSVEINLKTNKGDVGYRIKKLQLIQQAPGALDCEGLVKVWSGKPTTTEIANKLIDFEDNTILAVGFYSGAASAHIYPEDLTVIFENHIFNQNIYLSYIDVRTVNDAMNYYIELEQVKLNNNESTMATLQSIRSRYETVAGPT